MASTSASAGTRSGTTTLMLALVARIARASSSTDGAITASMRVETIARAVSTSMGRFRATAAPKADSASASRARTYASAALVPVAAPQGLVCLMSAAAGSLNSITIRIAASRSSRFVYDSSLP